MAARTPLVLGGDGLPQQLQPADTLASGLRLERYTTPACDANGQTTVTFSPAFKSPPLAFLIPTWSGATEICGMVTATTATTATVQLMVSRGTLLLTSGPFQAAPAGTTGLVAALGS